MRARLRIENPPGYFVAAAASQIVQTVGVIRSDFGSHTISWVDVCCNNIAFFPQGNVQSSTNTSGALCLAQPWPGMARTIHNDHQRFIETYCQPHPGTERCFYGAWMGKKKKKAYYSEMVSTLCHQVTSSLVMALIVLRKVTTRSLVA